MIKAIAADEKYEVLNGIKRIVQWIAGNEYDKHIKIDISYITMVPDISQKIVGFRSSWIASGSLYILRNSISNNLNIFNHYKQTGNQQFFQGRGTTEGGDEAAVRVGALKFPPLLRALLQRWKREHDRTVH